MSQSLLQGANSQCLTGSSWLPWIRRKSHSDQEEWWLKHGKSMKHKLARPVDSQLLCCLFDVWFGVWIDISPSNYWESHPFWQATWGRAASPGFHQGRMHTFPHLLFCWFVLFLSSQPLRYWSSCRFQTSVYLHKQLCIWLVSAIWA